MRGRRPALSVALTLACAPAWAEHGRGGTTAGFAEPGDIIAAEGYFAHLSAEKGAKAAIRATAAPDAQIYAPQLMRVADYANRPADPNQMAPWHTSRLWMSCDGSIAVTHGAWHRGPVIGWSITIWHRQKNGGYRWVLAESGPLSAALPESDMIAASVADCPPRRARSAATAAAAAPERGTAPLADYSAGRAVDDTLEWGHTPSPDGGRTFSLHIRQDGALREVLRASTAPVGG